MREEVVEEEEEERVGPLVVNNPLAEDNPEQTV